MCTHLECKKCQSTNYVKSGLVRGHQRYRCKDCSFHFIEGDRRTRPSLSALKALATLLYTIGRASFHALAEVFGVCTTTVYYWVRETLEKLPYPKVDPEIQEIEIDEMWHFLKKKAKKEGLSRPLIVKLDKWSPGWSAIVVLTPYTDFTAS